MIQGLPGWLSSEESACSAGDAGLIPGLGRFPRRRIFLILLSALLKCHMSDCTHLVIARSIKCWSSIKITKLVLKKKPSDTPSTGMKSQNVSSHCGETKRVSLYKEFTLAISV